LTKCFIFDMAGPGDS